MPDLCDHCQETDEEMEFGDCPHCGGHYCIECLFPDLHKCPEHPEEEAIADGV